MHWAHALVLAGTLGVSACAPYALDGGGAYATEQPVYADYAGAYVAPSPYGFIEPAPFVVGPPPRYGLGYDYGRYGYGRERARREFEWRQRREFIREREGQEFRRREHERREIRRAEGPRPGFDRPGFDRPAIDRPGAPPRRWEGGRRENEAFRNQTR